MEIHQVGAALMHTQRQADGWTNSLITFLPKTALLWQMNDVDYNQNVSVNKKQSGALSVFNLL
jgi:hypothetical protein